MWFGIWVGWQDLDEVDNNHQKKFNIIINIMPYLKVSFILPFLLASPHVLIAALIDGKLGTVTAGATMTATYDSRVFAMSTNEFNKIRKSNSSNISEIESEDDFIITFTPALHFVKKLGLFKISGTAGVNITQFIYNDGKSSITPNTSLAVDFDDTLGLGLALKKRVSNNAKIRFETTFDFGQEIGASILDQDFVSYTYINTGFNIRYNHSEKFGVGGGTSYSHRFYQTDSSREDQPNFDFSTLPLSAQAFYIYSEKLDFFTNYTFSRTKASSSRPELTSSRSHSISIGADGQFSEKLSGTASIGYTLLDFDHFGTPNRQNITTSIVANWKFNSKTSSNYNLSRTFSPTSTGDSTFTTSLGAGLTHRFTEDWSGNANISAGFSEITNIDNNPHELDSYGFGFSTSKKLSRVFTTTGSYNFTYTDSSKTGSYNRHVLSAQISGRF